MFWSLTSIYSQESPVYGSEKCLTSIYGNCMSIYGRQTKNIIKSSNVNIFWLEHFYTIRYDTFFHTFLCSTTYQKLVFYAGIPLTTMIKKVTLPYCRKKLFGILFCNCCDRSIELTDFDVYRESFLCQIFLFGFYSYSFYFSSKYKNGSYLYSFVRSRIC